MRAFETIAIATPESKATQIANQLRERLEQGVFAPGQRIPSRYKLAETIGVSCSTIDEAVVTLVKEGWLARRRGSGTVVRQRDTALRCVGVYEHYDYGANPESTYARTLCAAVQEILAGQGTRMRLWVNHRPVNQPTVEPMEEVVSACRKGQVQGVIVPLTDGEQLQWLRKLPVPLAIGSAADLPNAVTHDLAQGVELSLSELARLGCRSVGLISGWPMRSTDHDGSGDVTNAGRERFWDLMGRLGLIIRPEWLWAPEPGVRISSPSVERYGYEQFCALWRDEPHPDGLIVNDDIMARGVIAGLLEAGVRVPLDLKLVLHRNREVDLLCPLPASFTELSIRATAEALVSQIEKQFRGEACQRVVLPYRLVKQK
jgi:DNA-binding LacI/PurR family transcriptional regulator